MKFVFEFAYSFFILPVLWLTIRSLALISRKVRRGIRGRKKLFVSLETQVAHKLHTGKRIWFHASSLGEFEQAKPIIAELKRRHSDVSVIVTFFSPSGYEHSKRYQLADVISYIPFDTRAGARRFLNVTQPDVAVIIRYDVWPNHIWELERRHIPILIANATMRQKTKRRFPLVRTFHTAVYNAISNILTVSQSDVNAFSMFSLTKPAIEVVGDTRFDQVNIRSEDARNRHLIADAITSNKRVLVAGSSWPEDEAVLLPAFIELKKNLNNLLLIIVPHEPTIEHLEELETTLTNRTSFIRFSSLNDYKGESVIIVDSIGILTTIYKYAHLAYVGGSFKQNVHNVLEAAVYGIPVLYGPKHKNSQEAVTLAAVGGGFVVEDEKSLYRVLKRWLQNEDERANAGRIADAFVRQNLGATEKFLTHLEKYLSIPDAHSIS